MDSKKKFRLADKNKPGIDKTVDKLLAIFRCDRNALQKEIDGLQEQKTRNIQEQNYAEAAEISSFDTISEVYDVLEDCIFFEYAPKDVMDLCKTIIDIRPMNKLPKDLTTYERKLMKAAGLAKTIFEFTPYKFFFLGGAIAEHRTFFARDHVEAWTKANDYCIHAFDGNVRGILCLTKDGKDIGTLKNVESMFAPMPEDPKEVRSVRAVDLVPNYKQYS